MKTGTVTVVVIVGAAAALYLYTKSKASAAQPGLSLGNAGGVAHSPDITTGGAASVLSSLAPTLTSWFGGGSSSPSSVGTDRYSSGAGLTQTITNPVSAAPSVLPYSYKQQNIDNPSLLDTDSLFTPSSGSGSSGGYSDDGNDDILDNGFDYG